MKLIKSIVLAGGLSSWSPTARRTRPRPVRQGAVLGSQGDRRRHRHVGAASGIGMLAKGAFESMARQPEIAANIRTAMIIAAALIEGFTFFALAIIILQVIQGKSTRRRGASH